MLGLTDTHCHLNLNLFQQDLAEVLARAWDQGIQHILIPGIDLETSHMAIEIARRDPRLHAAVGFHPNDALKWNISAHEELFQLAQSPEVVAIGEIGLDFYRDRAPKETQLRVLCAQLELAADLNKPVILHSRDAMADLWPILQTWQANLQTKSLPLSFHPGVFHSYEGDAETARQVIAAHFCLGISGPVTFKNALQRQQTVAALPMEALLLETDAPFLSPHPHRGERNEPSFVVPIAEKIATLKTMSLESVVNATTRNAHDLFNWNERP
ncbi:MAG TPA: TatD family hydrolase [Anaerolineaceae bacterium]|nr:TatD family hydrolase [Anaerolineaceae bacterium]